MSNKELGGILYNEDGEVTAVDLPGDICAYKLKDKKASEVLRQLGLRSDLEEVSCRGESRRLFRIVKKKALEIDFFTEQVAGLVDFEAGVK